MILINIIEEKKIKNVDKEIPNISGSLKKKLDLIVRLQKLRIKYVELIGHLLLLSLI